jgi:hypothetical protein
MEILETLKTLEIAKREWENIRVSLERCGDIGEFDSEDPINARFIRIEGITFFRNLMEMDNKLPKNGYFTPEASYVFTTLASIAGERLGLTSRFAKTFGSGYAWVRTGCLNLTDIEEYQQLIKQLFFLKLFFPIGGFFNWDFNSQAVKTKLSLIFYKFMSWQKDPSVYIQDVKDYREQLKPLWRGLSSAIGFSVIDGTEDYEIDGLVGPWI